MGINVTSECQSITLCFGSLQPSATALAQGMAHVTQLKMIPEKFYGGAAPVVIAIDMAVEFSGINLSVALTTPAILPVSL